MNKLFKSQQNSNSPSSSPSVHSYKESSENFICPHVSPHRSVSFYQTNDGNSTSSSSRPTTSKSINLNDLPSYGEALTLPSSKQ